MATGSDTAGAAEPATGPARDPAAPGALNEPLSVAAERWGDRVAVRDGDTDRTFAELDTWSRRFAALLRDRGVRPGDRVAVRTANRVEFLVAVQAVSRAGAAAVLLSPAWREVEIDHALALTAPSHAVLDDVDAGLVATRLGAAAVTDLDRLPALPGPDHAPDVPVDPSDDAVLVFSSGTTGLPKAVRHTHASLRVAARQWRTALGLGPDDRFQVATPPSHILGLLNLLAAIEAGSTVWLHRRFDLGTELRTIEAERMTLEMAVAPIALAMANLPDLEAHDLSSLRYVMWCATPVAAEVAEEITARTGVPVMSAYGASEVPVLTSHPVASPTEWRLDSPGRPPAGVELRVVDLDTGEVVEGGVGEIEARSGAAMAGYLPDDANAVAFHDGWFRTGDVGRIDDDGWVQLTDRAKEMVKVSGFQVAPAEVEAVLLAHPAVLDGAVFGVPDERTGEATVAAVQLDPAADVGADELRALVAARLATYKVPRDVVVVDAVPRLPSGKALRRELRARWLSGELAATGAEAPPPTDDPAPPRP